MITRLESARHHDHQRDTEHNDQRQKKPIQTFTL